MNRIIQVAFLHLSLEESGEEDGKMKEGRAGGKEEKRRMREVEKVEDGKMKGEEEREERRRREG